MNVQLGPLLVLAGNARTCLARSSASAQLELFSVLREALARTLMSVPRLVTSVLGGLVSTPREAMSVNVRLGPDLTRQVDTALTLKECILSKIIL